VPGFRYSWLALWWLLLAPLVGGMVPSHGPLLSESQCPAVTANAVATGLGARRSSRRPTASKSHKLSGEARTQSRLEPPVSSGCESKTAVGNHPLFVVAIQPGRVGRDGGTLLPASKGRSSFVAVTRRDDSLARGPPIVLRQA
jgi:hypothetical protein